MNETVRPVRAARQEDGLCRIVCPSPKSRSHPHQSPCHHYSHPYPHRTPHCHPHLHVRTCSTHRISDHSQTTKDTQAKANIRISLIDLRTLRQLPIRLQTPGLIRTVLEYDVALLVLVVSKTEQDDVALVDPDFLSEFTADVSEALFAVEAEGFETAVAEHFDHLSVFCERVKKLLAWVWVWGRRGRE